MHIICKVWDSNSNHHQKSPAFLSRWTTCKNFRMSLHVYFMWIDILQPLNSNKNIKQLFWMKMTIRHQAKTIKTKYCIFNLRCLPYTFPFSSFCSFSNFWCDHDESYVCFSSNHLSLYMVVVMDYNPISLMKKVLSLITVISNFKTILYSYT